MITIETIPELRALLDGERAAGRRIGFVPTMGYLHDGHVSLMARSVADNDVTVASVFVNPLQFGAGEDLGAYPRDLPRDAALAAAAGVDVLFTPTVEEMYPFGPVLTTVSVGGLSARMEGASRPTHFAGVATVVAKLFAIVGASRAYFGEKDFQQLAVVRRMAADLSFPVDVVGCPIIREDDGLAMSSRNVYLTPDERRAATVLHRALRAGAEAVAEGVRSGDAVAAVMGSLIRAEPLAELDYAEVVDPVSLEPRAHLEGEVRLLVAAKLGAPRLLDNLGVTC